MDYKDFLGAKFDGYEITDYLNRGSSGMIFKAKNSLGAPIAIKILFDGTKMDSEKEAKIVSALIKIKQIAKVYNAGTLKIPKHNEKLFHYIVFEYIEGETLHEYMKNAEHIPTPFIKELMLQLCVVIRGMMQHGFEHNDLNSTNIILEKTQEWEIDGLYGIKIIDFGLAKSADQVEMTDMTFLSHYLLECLNINKKSSKPIIDKKHQKLISIINKMNDSNPERVLKDPGKIIEQIESISSKSSKKQIKLKHPFEYLSAEHIPENSDLIQKLYFGNVPWIKKITDQNTTIISGPRGSGKSMILKNMRLLTKLQSHSKKIRKINYIGFYIHCQDMFYLPFSGLDIKYNTMICNMFLHYFNLIITSEILKTLIVLRKLNKIKITKTNINKLTNFLNNELIIGKVPLLTNEDILESHKSLIDDEVLICQKNIQNSNKLSKQTSVGYLKNLLCILDKIFNFFNNKKIYILLDDYSTPKINDEIQKSINRLIAYRNNKFYFKITTEKYEFNDEDQDGKKLQRDREYSYVDLGASYINSKHASKISLIKNILNKRLNINNNITTDVDEYFESEKDIKISKLLRTKKNTIRADFHYTGFKMINELCMGDVSTILELYNEIYNLGYEPTKKKISSKIQNRVIRAFSLERFGMIKLISEDGLKLYNFVEEFAKTSQERFLKTNTTSAPNEIIRIELFGYRYPDRSSLYRKLISNNIFIEGSEKYSRKIGSRVVIATLYLRPIYTPALKISYNDRNAIRYKWDEFDQLFKNPKKISESPDTANPQKTLDMVGHNE